MKIDVTKSLNKFFEECFRNGVSYGLIPPGTGLVFDLYERVKNYPKAVIRVKDVDTLDHAWRTNSTVSFKLFVDGNDTELLNELSGYILNMIQENYAAIPLYKYRKVISDRSNPALKAGERVTADQNGKYFLKTKPERVFREFPPYLEENLVIYLYDYANDQELNELIKGVDFNLNAKSGEIVFLKPLNIPNNAEIRAFYIVRDFFKIGKIIPDTVLEIPMFSGDLSSPGELTTEILFHFIS